VRFLLTGAPAIDHDTQPLYSKDLTRGESIAIPIALVVLAFMCCSACRWTTRSSCSRACARSGTGPQQRARGCRGLEHTGRIITAAAIIMIAAFAGFTAGRFVGLQMFGLGLSAAIFLDATVVRTLLVPAVMRLLGLWNWWLPESVARIMRVKPTPTLPPEPVAADARAVEHEHV
jgi:hypothetical protein